MIFKDRALSWSTKFTTRFLPDRFLAAQKSPTFWIHILFWSLFCGWSLNIVHEILFQQFFSKETQTLSALNSLAALQENTQKSGDTNRIDISTMQTWNLFGSSTAPIIKETPELNINALKETTLALKLLGLIIETGGGDNSAIIALNDISNRYIQGDTLPIGNDVVLETVLKDRIVINNHGKYETLFLFDADKHIQLIDWRNNMALKTQATFLRAQLVAANNSALAKALRISDVRTKEGALQGIRLQPGSDKDIFASFGLQDGDILTVFDGVRMTDEDKFGAMLEAFSTATEAEFQIERGGQIVVIKVGFLKE